VIESIVEQTECEAIPWDGKESDHTAVELPEHEKKPEENGLVRARTARLRFADCEVNKECTEEGCNPKGNRKKNHFPEFPTAQPRKGIEAPSAVIPICFVNHPTSIAFNFCV
jgi:hypothetical protein